MTFKPTLRRLHEGTFEIKCKTKNMRIFKWDWDCPEIEREKIKIEDKKNSAGFSTNSMNLFRSVLMSLIDILIWVSLGQKYQLQPLGSPFFLRGNICPESCYHKFISFAARIWRVGLGNSPPLHYPQDWDSIRNILNFIPIFQVIISSSGTGISVWSEDWVWS